MTTGREQRVHLEKRYLPNPGCTGQPEDEVAAA